jgi:GNAT superfamily N-acetyltransferase
MRALDFRANHICPIAGARTDTDMASPMSGKDATSRSTSEQICLRDLEESDIDAAHSLSVAVGWPHRPGDWRAVLEIGHGYCAHDSIGRLVGTAMWWPIGAAFATIGMVIVAPGLQGRGLGRQMMDAVLEAARGRTLQLNATAAGMPLYISQGFRAVGAIRQYQGIARPTKWQGSAGIGTRPSTAEDWVSIAKLDRAAHGIDRRHILRALTGDSAGAVGERDGRVTGFAFCRPFGRGHMIGPIVAADEATAIALTMPFVTAHAGHFLRADIPEGAADFTRLIEECGLLPAGGGTTMIKGRAPRRSGSVGVFGLISQAIG